MSQAKSILSKPQTEKETRKNVVFNFVRYVIAIAYTPKERRPSEAKDIVRYFVNFSIKLFKDPDFRRKLQIEKRKKKAVTPISVPGTDSVTGTVMSSKELEYANRKQLVETQARQIVYNFTKYALKFYR